MVMTEKVDVIKFDLTGTTFSWYEEDYNGPDYQMNSSGTYYVALAFG